MVSNNNIKGISIVLDGETKGLDESLKRVNKHASDLRKEMREVETSLKFNPGNVELLEQQQRVLGDQISKTTDKLDALKGAYSEAEAQLSRGEIDQGEFDRLTREIIKTEDQLNKFQMKMKDVESKINLSDAEKEFQRVEAAIKDSDKAANILQSELKEVEDALKMDPGNADLIAQKQRVVGQMADESRGRLELLSGSLQELDAAAQRGDLGVDKFDKLTREVIKTEDQLNKLEMQMTDVDSKIELSSAEKEFQRVEAAIKDSDEAAGRLQSELKEVEQALRMDPGNAELIAQKQRVIGQMADESRGRLELLSGSFQELEAAAGRGELGVDKFDKLKREIITTEKRLEGLDQGITEIGSNTGPDKAEKGIQGLKQEAERAEDAIGNIGGALAGIGTAIGGSAILEKAFDTASLDNRIKRSIDLTETHAGSIKRVVKGIEAYGVDSGEALEGVRRQWALNSDATDEANTKIAQYAGMMSQTFEGIDFTEMIQETNEIARELEISTEEAAGLANGLLKIGFPPDQIDTIAEYGMQLKEAGFQAEEIQALFAAGVATGTWNIDNLMDGLKEGRIRAAEMGMGLSTGFKEAIAEATSDTNKMSEEQIESLKSTLSKQEEERSKALDKEFTNTQKHNDNLEQQKQKSLDKQLKNAEKNLDKQQQNLEKAHDKELSSAEKLADKKIELIDKEYTERLKLVDEERYNALKAVDAEIEGIENRMSADEKAAEDAANAKRKSELKARIAQAETAEERKEAQQDLVEFEEDLRRKQLRDQRRDKIDSLKEEKDGINEMFDARAQKIEEEQQRVTDNVKANNEAELEGIRERQQNEKAAFDERKTEQLENIRETNAADLQAFQESNDIKEERLKEMHDGELEKLQEINAKKIDAAMNPPETKLYTDTIKQLEDWGNAIAEGGEKGSEAYRDMVGWLNTIEDDTLRNAIGTEIFGTMWEDQGDNIVDTLLNMDEHMVTTGDNIEGMKDQVDNIEHDPITELRGAMYDLMADLAPLLIEIAEVAGSIAGWMGDNKKLVLTIGTIVGAIMGAGGLIFAVKTVWGIFSSFGGFLKLLMSPAGLIGLAILALVGLVIVIKKNWDPIKTFFSDLWGNISETFRNTTDGIGRGISNFTDGAKRKFSELVDKVKEIWNNIKDIFKGNGEMEKAGEDAGNGFIKGLQKTWSGLKTAGKNLGKAAWKGTKDFLGIKSPSRLMMGLGEFSGEGLAVGIESMSNRVDKASQRLATNVIPDIPDVELGGVNIKGGRGNGSSDGNAYGAVTINFNGDMSIRDDQDITKLARQIEAHITKKNRGRG